VIVHISEKLYVKINIFLNCKNLLIVSTVNMANLSILVKKKFRLKIPSSNQTKRLLVFTVIFA